MKMKLMKALALTFALAAGMAARAAGDLIEILPCDATGTTLPVPVSSVADPIDCTAHYFKLRLVNRIGYAASQPWVMVPKVAGATDPLKMYVYISGELREATYTGTTVPNGLTTDFVFSFTPRAGDLALPVVLATTAGRADVSGLTEGVVKYRLANDHLWGIYPNGDTTQAEAVLILNDSNEVHASRPEGGDWSNDYSLAGAGFYVKEVDFDSNAYSDTVWRSINSNDTTCVNTALPMLKVNSPTNTSSAFVYVWTKDPDVVVVDGNSASIGTEYAINGTDENGQPLVTKGLKMQVAANSDSKSFYLKAVGAVGATTTVFMADTPTNIYYNAGSVIPNFVTRTVRVDVPNPPAAKLYFNGEASTTTLTLDADADYQTTKATVMVELSEPYTADVTVTLGAKYTDATVVDLAANDYISLSTTDGTASWSQPAAQVTIPAGSTMATLYLHVLGGSSQTKDGIILSVDSIAGAGDHYATGAQATLSISPTTPKIANPANGAMFEGALTGESFLLEDFRIDDTYANRLKGTTEGYTVFYKRTYAAGGGDAKFQSVTFTNAIDGTAKDTANVLGLKLAKAGTATVTMYLQAPDGTKTATADYVTFTVEVTQSPQVTAQVTSGLNDDGTASEGATLQVKFFLSDANSADGNLYAFLVPADEATSNNVDVCTALATNGMTGVEILNGESASRLYATLKFKDGSAIGELMTFNVFLSEDKTLGAPDYATYPDYGYKAYDGYADGSLMVYVVNEIPTVSLVQLNGVDGTAVDGNIIEDVQTSQGIACTFATVVNEPSSTDLNALATDGEGSFYAQYTFYDGASLPQVITVRGNPNALSTEGVYTTVTNFTFQTAGTNKVTVALKDKDMDAYGDKFTFYVIVNATPGVEITSGRMDASAVYPEDEIGAINAPLSVRLTAAPNDPLEIGLKVDHAVAGDTFALPTLNLPVSNREIAPGVFADVYVVTFNAGYRNPAQNIYFTAIDGTVNSEINGVTITPYVLTDTPSPYAGKTYRELYTNLVPYTIYPQNIDPVIVTPTEASETVTNKTSIGVDNVVNWAVRDIAGDFAPNATVAITVEGVTTVISNNIDTAGGSVRAASGTYKFHFDSTGAKTVILTVTDKDGASATRTILYMIDPSKNVIVYPHGANRSNVSSASAPYINALGLGSGYVWQDGTAATDTTKMFTVRKALSFGVTATSATFAGLGDTTDWLGNNAASSLAFDSYLYGWIVTAGGEASFTGYSPLYGKYADYKSAFDDADNYAATVTLPSSDEFDETANAYADRFLEAIFSRELYAADNMGDINADGVPDFFAISKYKVVEADGAGGELADLSDYNEDGDYYVTDRWMEKNVFTPSTIDTWTAKGTAFDAVLEVRGFHRGLNYGMFKADPKEAADGWVSDLDLSYNEKCALIRAATGTWAAQPTATTMLADIDTDGDGAYSEEEIGAWLTTAAAQTNAKAFIDATWANPDASGWGFTVENRTDPTKDDTDNDGMPDGYEYYYWYGATVGFGGEPVTGSRFNLGDVENGTEISSAEIVRIFNPNLKQGSDFWGKQDTDGDGLLDIEEMLIGTSPIHWDTDGDGLSDLYELIFGLNPLSSLDRYGTTSAQTNPDGDYMASLTLGTFDIFRLGTFTYAVHTGGATVDGAGNLTVSGNGFRVAQFNGEGSYIPAQLDCSALADATLNLTLPAGSWDGVLASGTVNLVHKQVFTYLGFDPRTAWAMHSNGTVSSTSRWLIEGTPAPAGIPQNTAAYTSHDEYLLIKFRQITGCQYRTDGDWGVAEHLVANCTNPNVPFAGKSYGDSTTTYALDQHGADTDADGVPDGWELYVGFDPCIDFTIPPTSSEPSDMLYWIDATHNYSELYGGLSLLRKFAGTDSSAEHPDCATVVKHVPSAEGSVNYGWTNKHFPCNPWEMDTDGDGLSDAQEGAASWQSLFCYNRFGQGKGHTLADGDFSEGNYAARHFTIYGTPADTGARCHAGGGFNPCTIDTDEDGLPDPWERQYAGILFVNGAIAENTFLVDPTTLDIYDDVNAALIAAGMTGSDDVSGYRVLMGMDPTVADAVTSTLAEGAPDKDWDGDGLQNWQEYMVQALRHLRYDDGVLPLMGYDMPGLDENGEIVRPWVGTEGVLQLDLANEYSPEALDRILELGYTNFVTFVRSADGADYLRKLGYFADPPKAWDFAGAGHLLNKYMLPPQTWVARPVTRTSAVDEDGNEIYDYYTSPVTNDTTFAGIYTNNMSNVSDGFLFYSDDVVELGLAAAYLVELDGVGGGVATYYAYPHAGDETVVLSGTWVGTGSYVGTDPRLWDTDADGMDDYYELFHGLNPLLGAVDEDLTLTMRDVVSSGFASARRNAWVGWDNAEMPAYDPIRFPWMMGVGACDADGDGLRNEEEALNANLTAPNTTHTDPTPLWMTDTTVVTQSLPIVVTGLETNITITAKTVTLPNGASWVLGYDTNLVVTTSTITNGFLTVTKSPSYVANYYHAPWRSRSLISYWPDEVPFAYEQNEGYDTDNDWRADGAELVKRSEPASDPLDFSNLARRQSIHFGGDAAPGAAISYLPTTRIVQGANADLFKQFTVEAWVRPEATVAHDQFIVSRAANYAGWDLFNTNTVIRLNFALGIDATGCAFALVQDSTDKEARATGVNLVETKAWTHLAATYDGATLTLYVNGARAATGSFVNAPANGVTGQLQDPQGYFPYLTYTVVPSATVIGARPAGAGAFGADAAAAATDWSEVATDFFQGSVDEVRVWDGARTASDVRKFYLSRFTTAQVKSLRESVYREYSLGKRRNGSDAEMILSPELIQHYTFSTLAGAPSAAYVQQVPPGFYANVMTAVTNGTAAAEGAAKLAQAQVGWWSALATNGVVNSTVYTSLHVVPWIENTVGHLPRLDGYMADSVYWSEFFAGYTGAFAHGLDQYQISNAMNPYNLASTTINEEWYLLSKTLLLRGSGTSYAGLGAEMRERMKYEALFRGFTGTSDLVPLGSAYAERQSESWDGSGAEDAWAITTDGSGRLDGDPDGNGLPDWYTGDYATYWKELAVRGLVPNGSAGGTHDPDFVNEFDTDGDGLPDWWAGLYNLKGGAADDDDNDGLSNYTEFLLSEVFDIRYPGTTTRVVFDPTNPYSASPYDSDYFFRLGQMYVGEIFTDHDLMEDSWESLMGVDYVSRKLWDADSDKDEDGWRALSEVRYNEFVAGISAKNKSHLLNGNEVRDFPLPTVTAVLRYNGTQLGEAATNTTAALVIKAYGRTARQSDGPLSDATWRLTTGQTFERETLLGNWSDRTVRGTLTPGNIDPNSFDIVFSSFAGNETYTWFVYNEAGTAVERYMGGTYEEYQEYLEAYGVYGTMYYTSEGLKTGRVELAAAGSDWRTFIRDNAITVTSDLTTEDGYICFDGTRIGTINLVTGEYSLDLGAFANSSLGNATNGTLAVQNSIVKLTYTAAVPALQANRLELHLGEPDSGALFEGSNDFVAFYDLDGNGEYNPGEPFGWVKDVDVGWFNPTLEIELTDYSPIGARIDLWGGTDDRGVAIADAVTHPLADATIASNITQHVTEPVLDESSRYVRYRIVRWTVDGLPCSDNGFTNYVVKSGYIQRDDRTGLSEREFLGDSLDIDWDGFRTNIVLATPARALRLPVSEVTYLVVVGDGDDWAISSSVENQSVAAYRNVITRRYEPSYDEKGYPITRRATAKPVDTELLLNVSRPTFRWTIEGEDEKTKAFGSSYTAFALRVQDAASNTVYSTGARRMPGPDQYGVYSFTPEAYAGCELQTLSNYTWQVALLNAKYHDFERDESYWSERASIYVNLTESSDAVGKIRVAAKYFGPSAAFADSAVVVEAFVSPDFTGTPVARAVVTDTASVTNAVAHVENAKLIGLPQGTYYVRAYLDSKTYGAPRTLDAWESWGYICPRSAADNEWTFSPTAVTIGDVQGAGALFDCYIEDRDTNRNGLPDVWEMVENKGSLDLATEHITANISGVVVSSNLEVKLTKDANGGSFGAGLAAQALAAVKNAGIALLALDVTPDGSYSASLIGGTADSSSATGDGVTITAIDFTDGQLTIDADLTTTAQSSTKSTTSAGGASAASRVWLTTGAVDTVKTVTFKVLYKANLADATWQETGVDMVVTITADGTRKESATAKLTDFLAAQGNPAKCFFKIVAE